MTQPVAVRVDKDLCMSSGRCVAEAPEVFAFDDEELSEPVAPVVDGSLADLQAVAVGCPAAAIEVGAADGESG